MTIVETMDSGERGMNPVAKTIINPWKEYWPCQGSNQRPSVLKSALIPTELWGSALVGQYIVQRPCGQEVDGSSLSSATGDYFDVSYMEKQSVAWKGYFAGYW